LKQMSVQGQEVKNSSDTKCTITEWRTDIELWDIWGARTWSEKYTIVVDLEGSDKRGE